MMSLQASYAMAQLPHDYGAMKVMQICMIYGSFTYRATRTFYFPHFFIIR